MMSTSLLCSWSCSVFVGKAFVKVFSWDVDDCCGDQ